ncbi:MAG: hypothetical protein ACOWWR_04055 [Eubacteriales bacterium]
MMFPYEMINHLKILKNLLLDEKEALIHNEPDKILAIVEEKEKWMDRLSSSQGVKGGDHEKITILIEEIHSLQETNALLTKQALSFQTALLDTLANNIHRLSNTYSAKGKMYNTENHINIIDQSI